MGGTSLGGHERGKRGDGDLTRARILETAGRLVAECGYASVTSKQVCERAHVNMAAVNYHFGSREGLYAAVLAEAHDRLFTLERLEQILAEGAAREKLSRILDELLAHLHGPRSWHVRVLAREFFSPSGSLDPFLQEKVHPKARLLRGLLSEITGIPQGASQLDCCIATTMGTCMMLIMLDPAFADSLFPNLAGKSVSLDQMLKDFIFAGLDDAAAKWRARPPEAAAREQVRQHMTIYPAEAGESGNGRSAVSRA
ncbi:TetR/AcrR family transcriptional regulator [uncultured Desulfovibrio sp.]|uniref:TetR/AcrR family transcriptional regulator n=1 Tax=uncultured Desulfovibrio sp. TaxID=167968 RepID=UPI0026109127|nr:TetR/AcrR family transcriptional regulator [uncultured Desulfovibrio sp.]